VTEASETEKTKKRRVGRSPAYPYISVQKALEQAKALHAQEGDYAAPLPSAVSAWGYSPKSSGGRQTLATMKYYGLIEIAGEGDGRKIKVSDIARRILLDQREDESEKRQLIRRVALTPAAHKALYEQYANGLASDGSVEHFLIFDEGYNKEAAKELLAEFKDTARFAGLYEPSMAIDKQVEKTDTGGDNKSPSVKVGDKVQVTVNGVDTFPDGATVLGFTDDRAWVYTDQSNAAAKLEEVTLIEAAAAPEVLERPLVPSHLQKPKHDDTPKPGMRKAMFPLDEGDVTLIFPEGLTPGALTDLGKYLDIFLKKEQGKGAGDKKDT
jgi:hypothetical protein